MKLKSRNLITPQTLEAISARLGVPQAVVQFLDHNCYATLQELCKALKPSYPWPDSEAIAQTVDRQLREEVGEGWRYDAMPPAKIAYPMALSALHRELKVRSKGSFVELLTTDLIKELLEDSSRRAGWEGIVPKLFFESLLVRIATIVYSDPRVQEAIGYDGYADAGGWRKIGLNEREDWEL